MGTLVGHVAPGLGFLIIGLWHLFNNTKIQAKPNPPNPPLFLPWFPTSKFKYLEPVSIIVVASASVAMELFIGPQRHHPFDTDGTIPSYHLQNFEHSNISMTFLVFAAFSILLDRVRPKGYLEMTQLLGAVAFGQELLVFRLHSADHMGPEGQYHLVLQLVVGVCFGSALVGIGVPCSFLVAFVRSVCIVFQGLWLMLMGFALWTPSFIPKGCFIKLEDGHQVVRCSGDAPLHRAKSLINIQLSCLIIALTIFAFSFHLIMFKHYHQMHESAIATAPAVRYFSLTTRDEEDEEAASKITAYDIESQSKDKHGVLRSFIQMGHKMTELLDMER